MDTAQSPAASLPLPTEDQVKAFLCFHASQIAKERNLAYVYLACFGSGKADGQFDTFRFSLACATEASFNGKTIADALAARDAIHAPAGKLAKAQKLREEAEALEKEARAAMPAALFVVDDSTRIRFVENDTVCTWAEFVRDNSEVMSPEEFETHRRELAEKGETQGGGGSEAPFTLKIAA